MPQPCDLLVLAEVVLTQNAAREVIRHAAVAVTDGRVAAIGPAALVTASHAPREILDLGRSLVLPGLINTHTHAAMTLFRGLADDVSLEVWLARHIWPAEAALTPDRVRLGVSLACAEMLASGVTTFLDMYLFEDAAAEAIEVSGMRAVLGEGVFNQPNPSYRSLPAALAKNAALYERYAGHARLRPGIMPHAVYTSDPDMLRECRAVARDKGLLFSLHAAETRSENVACQAAHGQRVVPYLRDLGLLGPDTLLAHCVDLTDSEIGLLAETGTKVAHCPRCNMKLASGAARVSALRAAGVVVGLGTDGAASNNRLSILAEMDAASLLAKLETGDPTALPAGAALDMATNDAAACLGLDDIGALAPGRWADLTALDLDRPALRPLADPVSQVVYAAGTGDVRLTMVAGKILYRDGTFPTLDLPDILDQLDRLSRFAP